MTGDNPSILYGSIAVREKFVTPGQLAEAIRIQENSPGNPALGEILLDLNFIDAATHAEILAFQRQALQSPTASSSDTRVRRRLDNLFGKLAVSLGFTTPARMNECVRLQAKDREAGIKTPLGRILVDKGYLEEAQVLAILSIQENQIVGCPPCGKWYRAENGKVPTTCKHCGQPLRPATEMGSLDPREILAGAAETMAGPVDAPPDITQYVDETKRSLPAVRIPARKEPAHLGRLAVSLGILSQMQLDEALALQRRSQPPKPLGKILLERQYLSPQQLSRLLVEQERRLSSDGGLPAHVVRNTQLGELAVQQGFLGREDLNRLLREQAQNADAGYKQPIGRVLVEKGVLTPKSLDHLARRQRRMRRIAGIRGRVAANQSAAVGVGIAAALLIGILFVYKASSPTRHAPEGQDASIRRVAPEAVATVPMEKEAPSVASPASEEPKTEQPLAHAPEPQDSDDHEIPGENRDSANPEENWDAEVAAIRAKAQAEQAVNQPAESAPAPQPDKPAAPKAPDQPTEEYKLALQLVSNEKAAPAIADTLAKKAVEDPRAVDVLLLCAQDSFRKKPEIRILSLRALTGTKTNEIKAFLVDRPGEEPDPKVRMQVMRMLWSGWADREMLCFFANILKVDKNHAILEFILDEAIAQSVKDLFIQDVLMEQLRDTTFSLDLRHKTIALLAQHAIKRKETEQEFARQALWGKPSDIKNQCYEVLAKHVPEAKAIMEEEKTRGLVEARRIQRKLGEPIPDYPNASAFIPAAFFYEGRCGSRPIRVVIHTVEGTQRGTISWFRNKASGVSAHYVVGRDGDVAQMVRESDSAQHIWRRSWNYKSIGIEHEGYAAKNEWREDQYRASAMLTRYLCQKYKIPMDREHIISHAELNPERRYDPGRYFDWDYYLSLVQNKSAARRSCITPSIVLPDHVNNRHVIRRTWHDFLTKDNSRDYPNAHKVLVDLSEELSISDNLNAEVISNLERYNRNPTITTIVDNDIKDEYTKVVIACAKEMLRQGRINEAKRVVAGIKEHSDQIRNADTAAAALKRLISDTEAKFNKSEVWIIASAEQSKDGW